MPILQRCWTPYISHPWTNVRYGSYYTAVYSTLFHIAAFLYTIYTLVCANSNPLSTLYQHITYESSIALSATSGCFCIFILIATLFLAYGIRENKRSLFIPWLIGMAAEIILLAGLGVSFIALSYSKMYSTIAALILWCFDAFHIYCFLCVISLYQVLKDLEEPRFVVLRS